MGLGRLVLKLLAKSPKINGALAAVATSPYFLHRFNTFMHDGKDHTYADFVKAGLPVAGAFIAAYLGTVVLHVYTKETDTGERTHPGDRKIIRNLEARLKEQTPPEVFIAGEKELKYGIIHLFRTTHYNGQTIEQLARNEQNPLLALDAMLLYCGSERKMDDGFLLLADAYDWLNNRKPKLSTSGRIACAYENLAFRIARWLEPRNASEYILAATHDSILRPEHAWYWSALGRMAADEFKLPQRAEMYVFHALLATAQKRDDAEKAWKDAFAVLREQPVWERLSETRSVVRILKNSRFFAQTLVFKERESRESLLKEARASSTLVSLVEDIAVPQHLYTNHEPSDGRYTSIMRYVSGETLYERLKKGDKKDVPRVISTLAKIHARYPTEKLERLNLYKNLEQKLNSPDFKVPQELTEVILANYAPVYEAITNNTLWVWNKDAHPENWIIGEKIGVIDNEGDYLVPAFFDLVNLQEYGDFFTEAEKQSNIINYITEMQKMGKNINITTAQRAYRNSVIHRVIALASAWSSPDRIRMQIYKKQTFRKVMYAIDETRTEDPHYYERHRDNYLHLHKALLELHSLMPS